VERDKPKKPESVGQTLPQLPWKQKRRDLKTIVWSEFNIFCTLVTMAMAAILNLFNPPTAATHYSGYSYKVS
jgi:hypothetical protein